MTGANTVARIQNRERELGRAATENDLEPLIWQRFIKNKPLTGDQVIAAQSTLGRIARSIALLQTKFDVLLSPTLAAPR